MSDNSTVKVYVGSDRSQALAVKVLEHSIRRHSSLPVEVIPMLDLPVPQPQDPRNAQRTGFSFSRYCIPKLAGYRGRAIYMDADMLVFRDIRELWEMPMDGRKILIQHDLTEEQAQGQMTHAPKTRIKQSAVMLLDCDKLNWDITQIVAGLDNGWYDYEKLVYELCILDESEIGYTLPFAWNSLEHYDAETRLLHYTDMAIQPWVSAKNKNGCLWFDEVRLMLKEGALTWAELREEVRLGYFRPSLLWEIKYGRAVPAPLQGVAHSLMRLYDRRIKNYKPHREVDRQWQLRNEAIQNYETQQSEQQAA